MLNLNSEQTSVSQTLGLHEPHTPKKRIWKLLGWLLATVIIIFVVQTVLSNNVKNATQYDTEEARLGDLTITVSATGNLEPTNQVDLGIEVSGTVMTVEVDYNDRVEKGQVLARLDTSKLESQVLHSRSALESAHANVQKAEADVKLKNSDLSRLHQVRELSDGKVPSQTDMDAAEAAVQNAEAVLASAKAAVAEAEANLDVNETDLSKAVVHSPINGIVLDRQIEPGQTVAASFQAPVLFTLAEDLTNMELHVFVDEADVGQVREGQSATFTVDAFPDRQFSAEVVQVRFGSQESEGVITYETILSVDNSDLSLRPGMTATAEIIVETVRNAVLVPNKAFRFSPPTQEEPPAERNGGIVGSILPGPPPDASSANQARPQSQNGQQTVWTLVNGTATSITITSGSSDGDMTEVTEGDIKPGQPIIVSIRSER